jgi:hypothetical protein
VSEKRLEWMTMSHFFISYSHKNVNDLNNLLDFLKSNGFQDDEIWYDKNIQAGERWSEEIEIALDEAYAVVIIMTLESMSSIYVNYEWSWASGYGKSLVPLLFKDIADQHPILKIQHFDCRNAIPAELTQRLREAKFAPRLSNLIDRRISDLFMRFRVLVRVTLWAYQTINLDIPGPARYKDLLEAAYAEAYSLSTEKILEIFSSNSVLFTRKQRALFEDLYTSIVGYRDRLGDFQFETQYLYPHIDYLELLKKLEDYQRQVWEPLMDSLPSREDYKVFDQYLENISRGEFKAPFGPLLKYAKEDLSETEKIMVEQAIEAMKNHFSKNA